MATFTNITAKSTNKVTNKCHQSPVQHDYIKIVFLY